MSEALPANQAPMADLVLNPPAGTPGLVITADGSGSADDRAVTGYDFSWGDGTRASAEPDGTATHKYAKAGTYKVTIRVHDAQGKTDKVSKIIRVTDTTDTVDNPPVPRLSVRASQDGFNSDVVADGGDSTDDRGITGYQFDFGDQSGTVDQHGSTAKHHYAEPGIYEVSLTVRDATGATRTATQSVTISSTRTSAPGSRKDRGFTARANAASLTVISFTFDDTFASQIQAANALSVNGFSGTFYVNSPRIGSGNPSYMTKAQTDGLVAQGHEIAGHTLDHVDLAAQTTAEATRQICNDRSGLVAKGYNPVSFAYPFGSTNATVDNIVKNCGYSNARIVGNLRSPGYGCASCAVAESIPPHNQYEIWTNDSVKSDTTLAMLQTYVTQAENGGGGWVPLVFHSICSGCTTTSIDINTFTQFVQWMKTRPSTTTVRTVGQVAGGIVPPPPPTTTAPPTPTPTPTPTSTATTPPATASTVTIGSQSLAISGTNIYRSTNFLVYYTPAFGASTRTNIYGYEAVVVDNKITQVQDGVGNIAIPTNGYVLSGHGTSRTWLRANATVGATVVLS